MSNIKKHLKSTIIKLTVINLSLLFIGCQSKQEEWNNNLKKALIVAENSNNIVDTIFLGFRYGMNKKEVDMHFANLMNAKKVYINKEGIGMYDFNAYKNTLKTSFNFQYYNDSLYQLSLILKDEYSYSKESGFLCAIRAYETLQERAKAEGYNSYIYDMFGNTEYYLIKGNSVIKFYGYADRGIVEFTNQPIINKINKKEREKEKSTANDF
nr:MAG TPA: hypothetical protein [Caudoviricetes sp.]